MERKLYDVILCDNKIRTTVLEKADPPMGVVCGQIHLIDITSGYDFFKTYCLENDIEIINEYPDIRLIITSNLADIRVFSSKGIEIKGLGNNIEGMDNEGFEVNILGVPYPFFEQEFPEHMVAYNDQFKNR